MALKNKVRDLLVFIVANPAVQGTEVPRPKREGLREAEDHGLIHYGGRETGWLVTPRGETALQSFN